MKLLIFLIVSIASSTAVKLKLKVFPEPDDSKSTLIWSNATTELLWSEKLDNYLEVYRSPLLNSNEDNNFMNCDYEHPVTEGKVCRTLMEKFNPCVNTRYFGYRSATPCVFIELQKVKGWQPRYYNNLESLPKNMPQSLKQYINEVTQESFEWEHVWISCDGDTPADKELIGPLKYLPQQGYPGYMFPFTGQQAYLNPIIALFFSHPKHFIVINVVCKVWGPGIEHDEKNGIGTVAFQILLDK